MALEIILGTIIAAIMYSLSAYWKKKGNQEFDAGKVISTAIFGLIVGIVAVVSNVGFENVYLELASTGFLTVIIENVCKAIWRQIQSWRSSKKKVSKKKA